MKSAITGTGHAGALAADSSLDDLTLLDRHVAGDADAFAALVQRHYDYLWRLAIRTSFNREDAADALQEALVSAYKRAHSFRRECPVQGWLYRIVVNACLDRMRAQKSRSHAPLSPQLHEKITLRSTFQQDPSVAIIVAEALTELPPDQRDAVVVVDMLRFTVAETAILLNVPPGTVKSRCSRGRAKLSGMLTDLRLES